MKPLNKVVFQQRKFKILDMNHNVTNDVISNGNEFIKMEDHSKRDNLKNACFTEIANIPMNEEYDFDFIRTQINII